MEGFLISVSVLLAAIFREYGWTMLAIAVAVLLGYTLGSRLANATEAYTRHACCTDIARLASLVYLAHRTHPKHQKKKIMRAMWIVPVGLLLSNCSGGGGLVGSIDDSYCRRQVEQKNDELRRVQNQARGKPPPVLCQRYGQPVRAYQFVQALIRRE